MGRAPRPAHVPSGLGQQTRLATEAATDLGTFSLPPFACRNPA
jgi:hypothetical protein